MDGGYIIASALIDTTGSFLCLIKTNSIGDTLWTKSYGNQSSASDIQQTPDSGYVICGTTSFGAGVTDAYLLRINAYGDTLWTKTYGGNNFEQGNSVKITTDLGYIIAGHTVSFGALGHQGIYLIKTNSSGDTLWTKSIGGGIDEVAYSICQTPDGGYIVLGKTTSFGAGNEDIYLVKTDGSGNVLWNKTYGGVNYETGYSIVCTYDGGYVLTGVTNSFITNNPDVFLIKTDSIGNIMWSKTYGGISSEEAHMVVQTTDSGFAFQGYSLSFGTGSGDFYLVKTDKMGNSNCNETNVSFTISSPVPGIINTPSIVGSANTIVTSPLIAIGLMGTDSTLCTSVGIEESFQEITFNIFPNPSNGQFQIVDHKNQISEIEIYNIFGQVVFYKRVNEKLKTINLNVKPGIYFVKVFDNKKSYCKKLIIEQN